MLANIHDLIKALIFITGVVMELKANEFGVVLSVDALKMSRQSPLSVGIGGGNGGGGGGGGSSGGQGGGCGGCSNGCSGGNGGSGGSGSHI